MAFNNRILWAVTGGTCMLMWVSMCSAISLPVQVVPCDEGIIKEDNEYAAAHGISYGVLHTDTVTNIIHENSTTPQWLLYKTDMDFTSRNVSDTDLSQVKQIVLDVKYHLHNTTRCVRINLS